MRARTWFGTIGLLVAVPVGVALAQSPPGAGAEGWNQGRGPGARGFGGRGIEERLEHLADRLELTAEQRDKIRSIHESGEAQRMNLHKQTMRLRNEIEGEMLKDAPDKGNVVRLTEQIGGVRTKLQVQRVESQFAMREVLTPEQRDKFMGMRGQGFGERDFGQGRQRRHH